MPGRGGAHDIVGGRYKQVSHFLELRGGAVGKLQWGNPLARRGLLHLLAVLVHAGHKQHVVSVEPLEAGDDVGGDALIGVADMGRAIGIGNRRGDIVFFSRHRFLRVNLQGLIECEERIDNRLTAVEV